MWPVVTDGVVCSLSLSVTVMSLAETVEPITMPFGLWTWVCPRKHVLDGSAHWHYLANTIESTMCGGDAAFLSNYFDHLFCICVLHMWCCGCCNRRSGWWAVFVRPRETSVRYLHQARQARQSSWSEWFTEGWRPYSWGVYTYTSYHFISTSILMVVFRDLI